MLGAIKQVRLFKLKILSLHALASKSPTNSHRSN